LYNLKRSSYEKEWGTEYHRAGIRTKLVTWVIRIFPKSGLFRALPFRTPTPEVEKMFMASFNATVDNYRTLLDNAGTGRLKLANQNFDVGQPPAAGKYLGADEAYDQLVDRLAARHFAGTSPQLRANLLDYYEDRKAPAFQAKKAAAQWEKVTGELDKLRATDVIS